MTSQEPRQELAGFLGVEATARRIRWYRYAEERMMRTLAGWIAITPELPAKLALGRHVWDCAQHADAWGRRLPELRAPAQVSTPPNEAFVQFMDRLESPEGLDETVRRLTGIYVVLKPHLVQVYEAHLAGANEVYEPPTRRILERLLVDERRHIEEGSRVLADLSGGQAHRDLDESWQTQLRGLLELAGGVTGGAG